MALTDLADWMDENTGPHTIWYVKRLAANDTLASGAHQAGPYVPKEFLFDVFPSLNRPDAENPDVRFELRVDSHGDARQIRAVWYNNKLRGGTRNETRLTNFGGGNSALLDPESTGALAVFSFHRQPGQDASACHVWVCDFEVEADLVEDRIGPVEPGKWKIWSIDEREQDLFTRTVPTRTSCWLETHEIPQLWLTRFPTGLEIIRKTMELRPDHGVPVDTRLMKRRECEFEIYRSVEQAVELPFIREGFDTVEKFITRAQTILQRRKSRSGKSLELHAREIFIEENLREGQEFDHQPESDPGKRPDFLFPSQAAYKNPAFPTQNLRMLAAKTTCKDRWRQILNEASRIETKHLLTLQEGVSESQFREMTEARVQLVVPRSIIPSYPQSVQPHLQTLESFIGDIRLLNVNPGSR
jgi:hypothetical protein